MAVGSSSQVAGSAGYAGYDYDEERGSGWVAFAGVLLLILGTLNSIEGIAAIGNANFFVHNTHYVFGNLKPWGWVVLCIGVAELAVGFGVFARNQLPRRRTIATGDRRATLHLAEHRQDPHPRALPQAGRKYAGGRGRARRGARSARPRQNSRVIPGHTGDVHAPSQSRQGLDHGRHPS